MSDKEVCRKVLEKILGVSIREVSIPATQKTITLTKILLEENRTDDLKRALEDADFRNKLFEEYDIL